MEGWIKLHRAIQDWDIYLSEPFTYAQAWIDLILLANHKDGTILKRGNIVAVRRGQVGWSMDSLACRWQWSRGKVGRYLGLLKLRGQIEQQNSNLLGLITIINYEDYQGSGTTDSTTNNTTDGRQTEQQTDTNKKNKNVKNEKKKTTNVVLEPNFFEKIKNPEERTLFLSGFKAHSAINLPGALDEFLDYWLEGHEAGKPRWKGEKYFDPKRRFRTWIQFAEKRLPLNQSQPWQNKNTRLSRTELTIEEMEKRLLDIPSTGEI